MRKFLIVVDMQKDFVNGALGSKESMAIIDNVINKINKFDDEIIVTYDTHLNNYMNTREGKYLPIPHCIYYTEGWELDEKVENALIGKDIAKFEKNTFGSVELIDYFKNIIFDEKDVEVTLIGLCTDICVVSNAMLLKAYFPEMSIIVDASCCAGVTPESHEAALLTMKMCQIDIINE